MFEKKEIGIIYRKIYIGVIKIKIIEKTLNKGEIIPLTFDPIFTSIFNNEENICILEDFISIYFDIPINEVIGNLKILSRKLNKNNKLEASKEVDLLLTLNGVKINIELSNRCTIGVRERNLVYICGQHSKQLKVGDKNYQNIKDSIQICINNFNCNEIYAIESYYLMNKRGKIYSKKLRIDLIDLEKIKKLCYPISNKKYNLLKIFTTNKKVELEKYLEGGIMRKESKEKLIKNVERYSSDEDVFTLYTELSKSELEKNTMIAEARNEGILLGEKRGQIRGEKRGINKRNIQIAKSMYAENIDINIISRVTNLEINKLYGMFNIK